MHLNTPSSSYKPNQINLSIETVYPVKGEAWVLEVGLKGRRMRANPSQSSSTTEALFFKNVNLKFPFVTHGDLEFKLSRSGHVAQGVFELETLANSSNSKVIQRKTQLTWMGGGSGGLGPAPVVDFRITLDPPPPACLAESVWQVPTPDNIRSEKPDNLLFVTEDKRRSSKQLNVASIWGGMVDESIIGAPPPMRKRNSTTTTAATSPDSDKTNTLKQSQGSSNSLGVRVPNLGKRRESCSEIEQADPMIHRRDRHVDNNDDDYNNNNTPSNASRHQISGQISGHYNKNNHSSANSSSGSSCRHSERKDYPAGAPHSCCNSRCNTSTSCHNEECTQCTRVSSRPSPHSSSSAHKSSTHSYGERESGHHNNDSNQTRHHHSPCCCQHSHNHNNNNYHQSPCHSNERTNNNTQSGFEQQQQHYHHQQQQQRSHHYTEDSREQSSTHYRRGVEERKDSRRDCYSNAPPKVNALPPPSAGGGYFHDQQHQYPQDQENGNNYDQHRRHSKQVDLNNAAHSPPVDPRLPPSLVQAVATRRHYH